MAKSKWLEAQHALKRNSLRKDNPHIRILTHFTHSWFFLFFLHTVIVNHDCPTIHARVTKIYKYIWTIQAAPMTHTKFNSTSGNFTQIP